jgi:hypothetical protein
MINSDNDMESKMEKKKRIIIKTGDICKVPLDDGDHNYCIKLDNAMAFLDYKGSKNISIDEIIEKKILFIIHISKYAPKDGNWEKIGKEKEFINSIETPNYFTYDKFSEINKFNLYISSTGEIRPSTFEEIKNLEIASVWESNHIRDRIRDYYLSIEYIWQKIEKEIKHKYMEK